MRTFLHKLLAAGMLWSTVGIARADLIDAFQVPVAPVGGLVIFSATPGDPIQLSTLLDDSALGGNRGVYGEREVIAGDSSAVNYEISGQQQFRIVNSTSGEAGAQLLYGFGGFTNGDAAQANAIQSGNYTSASLPLASLGRSLDPLGGFAFEYQNSGILTDLQVTIVTGRNEGNATMFSSSLFVLPQATSDTTFFAPFSSFLTASPAAFEDIDQIIFRFSDIPANTVLAFDNLRTFSAVPEPSGMVTLGLVAAMTFGGWMCARRRMQESVLLVR